jgi:hypothetical protein
VPVAATEERAPSAIAGAIDYVSEADRFAIALPVEPTVEGFTYTSAQYSPWAARRYTAELDGHTYRMTVVDMTTSRLREGVDAFRNTARPGSERSGALAHAAWNLRMTGTVSVDSYVERQAIPGIRLEIAIPGGERNLAEIYEHNDYLYILEDLEAPITTEGIEIHASLQLLDTDGNVPTYVDDGRTFPDYFEIVGDGTGAAGRDTGAIARGQAAGQ